MLVVSALGSCRVTNPVRKAAGSFPIRLNNARVYGYVHSTGEILQQIRFLRREFSIPDALRPLIAPHVEKGLHENANHRSSDIYIIEISSAKSVRIGAVFVQWNHVSRHFAAFLNDASRARTFSSLARGDCEDEKLRFLDNDPVYRTLGVKDQHILRELTIRTCSPDELRRDVAAISDELPKVLFVTHCNALLPEGKPIPGRDRFVTLLRSVLAGQNAVFSDPTDLMRVFGQNRALLDESSSLAHYTDDFEHALFAHWYDTCLSQINRLAMAG
jgi:hypothetical protein